VREVPCAPATTLAHCANSLKILERSRLDPGNFVAVEVERRHPAQQEVGRVGTTTGESVELGNGHTDIFGHALQFGLAAAFQSH
jgi:hypothetical protein